MSSAQSKQERAKEWALGDDTDGPDGLVCDDNVLASVALEDVGDGRELPLAHIHSLPPYRQQPQPLQARCHNHKSLTEKKSLTHRYQK